MVEIIATNCYNPQYTYVFPIKNYRLSKEFCGCYDESISPKIQYQIVGHEK